MPWIRLVALVLGGGTLAAAGCDRFSGDAAPRVADVQPARIDGRAPAFVIVQGGHFARDASASLGAVALPGVTWVNGSTLTVEIPAGMTPGAYPLSVTNPGGGHATLPVAVTVAGPAQAQAAQPAPATPTPAQAAPPSQTVTQTAGSTRTPAAATASPAVAATPPAATPTLRPTVTRTATRSPEPATVTPNPANGGQLRVGDTTPNLAGTWQIADTVSYGPGAGQTFTFTIVLQQQGATLSGQGDGLRLTGLIEGRAIHASYTQDSGATGSFDWTLDAGDGSFSGSFTNSIGNGGASAGRRLSGAYASVVRGAEADPQPLSLSPAKSRGNGKKKGH